ncbi:hypothetical protein [Comamonas terrigena]|uniref:hypothetical protein n=1 Tax=Comamonas terrigena TaxID=32013 RepID=UPI0028B043F4|nr:hypothetical protein [Comamonas terrigena]
MYAATGQQIALLLHTLGLRPDQRNGNRNHFVAGPGHDDIPDLEALESMGLMVRTRTPAFCDSSDIVFRATEAGRALALERLPEPPPPPKRTRYDEYLAADGCAGDSFGEFLCGWRLPKFETRGYCGYGVGNTLEYRMYRKAWDCVYGHHNDVQGEWAKTKKEAKASYKAALKARKEQSAAAHKEER